MSCSFKWGGKVGFIKKVKFAQRLGGEGISHVDIERKKKCVSYREKSSDQGPSS